MHIDHRLLVLSLATLIASAGCRSSAPLAGSWENEACFGTNSTPTDIERCSTNLTFTDGLEVSLAAVWVSLPATANHPGCITTKEVTGQSWSTRAKSDFDVMTITGGGDATIQRNGCVYPDDDLDREGTSGIAIPVGEIEYQIEDEELTILTSILAGVYEL